MTFSRLEQTELCLIRAKAIEQGEIGAEEGQVMIGVETGGGANTLQELSELLDYVRKTMGTLALSFPGNKQSFQRAHKQLYHVTYHPNNDNTDDDSVGLEKVLGNHYHRANAFICGN